MAQRIGSEYGPPMQVDRKSIVVAIGRGTEDGLKLVRLCPLDAFSHGREELCFALRLRPLVDL